MASYNNEITVPTINGDITVWSIDNDSNGNPRFVVHYLSLGLDDYISISKFGLDKYRAKWFGGGYVFSYYGDLTNFLNTAINKIKKG